MSEFGDRTDVQQMPSSVLCVCVVVPSSATFRPSRSSKEGLKCSNSGRSRMSCVLWSLAIRADVLDVVG